MRSYSRRESTLTLLPPYVAAAKAAATRLRTTRGRWVPRAAVGEEALRILHYHRISDDRDSLAVPPEQFRQQMALLRSDGYVVVDLVRAFAQLQQRTLPPRAVAITFDDGYRDVLHNAVPVLEGLGFMATVFVVTGVLDGTCSFPWYRHHQPPVLDWQDVMDLDAASPLTFEAHSVTHPDLRRLTEDAAVREISDCREVLEQRLGRRVTAFCYPVGLFGEREKRLVARAGYDLAVSCEPGMNEAPPDPWALRRTQVERLDSLSDFVARLSGTHDRPLPLRDTVRRLRYGAPAQG